MISAMGKLFWVSMTDEQKLQLMKPVLLGFTSLDFRNLLKFSFILKFHEKFLHFS